MQCAHHKRNFHGCSYSPILRFSIALIKMLAENSPHSQVGWSWVLRECGAWWWSKWWCASSKCTPAQCSTLSWSETLVLGTSWILQRCKIWLGELMFKCFYCLSTTYMSALTLYICTIVPSRVSTGAYCKGQGYPLCEKNAKCPVQDACAEKELS